MAGDSDSNEPVIHSFNTLPTVGPYDLPTSDGCKNKVDGVPLPTSQPFDSVAAGTGVADVRYEEDTYTGGNSELAHVCDYPGCGKQFSRPFRLNNHRRVHTGERPFACGYCGNAYTRKAHLSRHIDTNHANKDNEKDYTAKFPCDKCEQIFTQKHNLVKHMRRLHSEQLRYQCEQCSERFLKHRLLKRHMTTVHGEKRKCDQCDFTTTRLSNLKRHKRTHDGYMCHVCGEVLIKWSDFVMHQNNKCNTNTRQDEKLVKCDHCERRFQPRYLKIHRKVHLEERPVVHCPEDHCPRYFYFLKNMLQHVKSYHHGNRFQCSVSDCGQKLSSKQKLKEHLLSVHGTTEKPKCKKRKPRTRKDKGTIKKPMAAVIINIEVKEGKQLLNLTEKQPLEDIETIRQEAKEFVGSEWDTSDNEGFVGCGRAVTYKACSRRTSPTEIGDVDEIKQKEAARTLDLSLLDNHLELDRPC